MIHRKGLVLGENEGTPWLDAATVGRLGIDPSRAHYLGRMDGEDVFVSTLVEDPAAPFVVNCLRNLFGQLDDETFAVAGRATQIAVWLDTHRFCGRCATPTELTPGERALSCPACKLAQYPRVTPAVIVLVRRGARALLARSGRFPVPFFSTLAGFVETGESLEQTIVREIHEEVGIDVKDIRYFGSQPWPFPHQLMIGFTAEHAGGEITVDGDEIAEASWFESSALPIVPPKISIARALIDAWVADVARSEVKAP
ncbi:NAD(+) diphosphatase [soil metagenome]